MSGIIIQVLMTQLRVRATRLSVSHTPLAGVDCIAAVALPLLVAQPRLPVAWFTTVVCESNDYDLLLMACVNDAEREALQKQYAGFQPDTASPLLERRAAEPQ